MTFFLVNKLLIVSYIFLGQIAQPYKCRAKKIYTQSHLEFVLPKCSLCCSFKYNESKRWLEAITKGYQKIAFYSFYAIIWSLIDIVWKIMGWTLSNIGMFGTKQSWFSWFVWNAHLKIATFRIYAPWFSEQYYACIRFVCRVQFNYKGRPFCFKHKQRTEIILCFRDTFCSPSKGTSFVPTLSFSLSGRQGELEISQHALFIIYDRHKLSGGYCWGPASECVCPCLKPKQSLLTYTHSTTRWQTRQFMPILFVRNPKSTYQSLDNPQRVCRDSYKHTWHTWAQISTNRCILFT